jgi:hypothetical protein
MLRISDRLQINFCVDGEVRKFDEVCWLARNFARKPKKITVLDAG